MNSLNFQIFCKNYFRNVIKPLQFFCRLARYDAFWFFNYLWLERKIKKSIIWNKLQAEIVRYKDITSLDPDDALKYLELDKWLRVNILRCMELGLHKVLNAKILDIGCGSGFFLYICKILGHKAIGIDQDEFLFNSSERIVYKIIPEILDIDIIRCNIKEYEPIELNDRYDLITAFMVSFNKHKQPDEWGRDEWFFFIKDILKYINQGGKIYLSLNANPKRYNELSFYDIATYTMFNEWDAIVRPGVITINSSQIIKMKETK